MRCGHEEIGKAIDRQDRIGWDGFTLMASPFHIEGRG